MPEPFTEDRRDAANTGLPGHLAGLLGASAGYLKARLELAGMEGKEALGHYAIIIGLAVVSLVVILFGYFFLCFGLIFAVADLIHRYFTHVTHTWIWVTLGFALLHFGIAASALLIAKARLAEPMFKETLSEFKKDEEWLTHEKAI